MTKVQSIILKVCTPGTYQRTQHLIGCQNTVEAINIKRDGLKDMLIIHFPKFSRFCFCILHNPKAAIFFYRGGFPTLMYQIPGPCLSKFWFSWTGRKLRNLNVYQVALSDFDPGVPLTMFEKLDVNTSNFPTYYVLRDYVEDGIQCNFLWRNFCISGKTVVFMMLFNIAHGSSI